MNQSQQISKALGEAKSVEYAFWSLVDKATWPPFEVADKASFESESDAMSHAGKIAKKRKRDVVFAVNKEGASYKVVRR